MTLSAIPSGLYDLLITERLERLLAADASARHQAQPLTEDAAEIIADTLVRQLGALLDCLYSLRGRLAYSTIWLHRFTGRSGAALQRLWSVVCVVRTHADCHQAAAGRRDHGTLERQQCEAQRS